MHRRRRVSKTLIATTLAALMLAVPVASAELLFDSLELPIPLMETRQGGYACGTQVTATADTVINQIGIYSDPTDASFNVRFIIMAHDTEETILLTDSKNFADAGPGWYLSDAVAPVTLLAGVLYDIVGIPDAEHTFAVDFTATTMGGLSSALDNPNFSGFDSPVHGGHGGADCATRLYNSAAPALPDFSCTMPDDGTAWRAGKICDLGTATEDGKITGRSVGARDCRFFIEDADARLTRITSRGTALLAGETVKAYCDSRFTGSPSITFEPTRKV